MNTISIRTTGKIFKYELSDVIRSKWIIAYTLFFLVLTDALFRFGGNGAQVMLSLMNAVLILIPLVCIVFGTMYLYNAREFTELMLSQPVHRFNLFSGLYLGLALPLSAGFLAGVILPFLLHNGPTGSHTGALLTMLGSGMLLTFIFVALAFLTAIRFEDRVKGLGIAIFVWLFFSVLYDGMVLALVSIFSDYPLEKPILALTILNPIDLARVLLLLNFDISALMGYTGAVFELFFGSSQGVIVSLSALVTWFTVPLYLSHRLFIKKDF